MSRIFKSKPKNERELRLELDKWLRENIFTKGEKFSFIFEGDNFDVNLKWENTRESTGSLST